VGAIALQSDDKAEIDESSCIRCGKCHDACPEEAVRHDSENIPKEVAANLAWVRKLLNHDFFKSTKERAAFMGRIDRYFKMRKKVIAQTQAALETLGEDPAGDLDAAIRSNLKP
jgi:ferredoxin